MAIRFTKMHGLGNDFMVLDGVRQEIALDPHRIRRWADRHFGVGFDQLLLVEPAKLPDVDFHYRIFNADGGEVEQCGNGARCFAQFVQHVGLTDANTIKVSTQAGVMTLECLPDNQVKVAMGVPQFIAQSASAVMAALPEVGNASAISMGNPHCVLLVDNIADAPVMTLSQQVAALDCFPQGVNVGFMQIMSRTSIALRVVERGVGETLACGSGAVAAVAAGIQQGLLDNAVTVRLPGGTLMVQWPDVNDDILMIGPAVVVYEGVLD